MEVEGGCDEQLQLTLTTSVEILVKVFNSLAEINEHGPASSAFEQHVAGVDVAVCNANLVAVLHGQNELREDVLCCAFIHSTSALRDKKGEIEVRGLRFLQHQNQVTTIDFTNAQELADVSAALASAICTRCLRGVHKCADGTVLVIGKRAGKLEGDEKYLISIVENFTSTPWIHGYI